MPPITPHPPSCHAHPHPALCSVAWQRSVVPGTAALLASGVLGLCGEQLQAVGDEAGMEALYRVSARLSVQQATKMFNNMVMPTLHGNSGGCCKKMIVMAYVCFTVVSLAVMCGPCTWQSWRHAWVEVSSGQVRGMCM